MALTKIQAAGLTADLIDETKLADNSIDSEHYNDGSIDNAHLADDAVGVDELSATGTASSSTFLRGDNSWATPTDTNTQLSTEEVQDIVGAMFTGNTETNITATYEDSDGTIDLVVGATGAALTGSTNNTITTVTGANAIQGEANLTFDGSALVESAGAASVTIKSTNANTAGQLHFDGDAVTTADYWLGNINGKWNGNDVAAIRLEAGDDTTNKDDGRITFNTSDASSTPDERMRIEPSGKIGIGTASPHSDTKVHIYEAATDTSAELRVENNRDRNAYTLYKTTTGDWACGTGIGGAWDEFHIYDAGQSAIKLTVKADGDIAPGGSVVLGSGEGINFHPQGGSDVNLLNDYEEGTWTPGLWHQGASNNSGTYTKIGRVVFANFTLQADNAAGNTNQQRLASLPFTASSSSPRGGCARGWQNYNSQGGPLYDVAGGTTYANLHTNTGGNLSAADLGTTYLGGTIIYITD